MGHRVAPNVVVVLMDGARASDFPPQGSDLPALDGFGQLLAESVNYRRAATVCPWTIPSHASLFSGLYPWIHGVHHRGVQRLPRELPRIATYLRAQGYESLSLSGNAFLTPASGLLDDFDVVGWCRWGDAYLRSLRHRQPAFLGPYDEAVRRETSVPQSWFRNGAKSLASLGILEFPFVVDGANRVLNHLQGRREVYTISPWIEEAFDSWLRTRPADRPIFSFVNLIETHDPYLTDPGFAHSLREWWRFAQVRQQPGEFYLDRWSPSAAERDALHTMYVRSIAAACRRVMNLVSILKAHSRWDDTLFFLTSDHGNSFGEDGIFFHGLAVTEPLIRIPLYVRYPRGELGGTTARGWASLVDVFATILAETDAPLRPTISGVPLRDLVDQPRKGPVFAASDGVQPTVRRKNLVSIDVVQRLDRVWAAAYEGDEKAIYDASNGTVRTYSLVPRHPGPGEELAETSHELSPLAAKAQEVGRAMVSFESKRPSTTIADRLASWGYV